MAKEILGVCPQQFTSLNFFLLQNYTTITCSLDGATGFMGENETRHAATQTMGNYVSFHENLLKGWYNHTCVKRNCHVRFQI